MDSDMLRSASGLIEWCAQGEAGGLSPAPSTRYHAKVCNKHAGPLDDACASSRRENVTHV